MSPAITQLSWGANFNTGWLALLAINFTVPLQNGSDPLQNGTVPLQNETVPLQKFCTAAHVGSSWFLTAASCFPDDSIRPDKVKIMTGFGDFDCTRDEPWAFDSVAESIIMHPGEKNGRKVDLAMVRSRKKTYKIPRAELNTHPIQRSLNNLQRGKPCKVLSFDWRFVSQQLQKGEELPVPYAGFISTRTTKCGSRNKFGKSRLRREEDTGKSRLKKKVHDNHEELEKSKRIKGESENAPYIVELDNYGKKERFPDVYESFLPEGEIVKVDNLEHNISGYGQDNLNDEMLKTSTVEENTVTLIVVDDSQGYSTIDYSSGDFRFEGSSEDLVDDGDLVNDLIVVYDSQGYSTIDYSSNDFQFEGSSEDLVDDGGLVNDPQEFWGITGNGNTMHQHWNEGYEGFTDEIVGNFEWDNNFRSDDPSVEDDKRELVSDGSKVEHVPSTLSGKVDIDEVTDVRGLEKSEIGGRLDNEESNDIRSMIDYEVVGSLEFDNDLGADDFSDQENYVSDRVLVEHVPSTLSGRGDIDGVTDERGLEESGIGGQDNGESVNKTMRNYGVFGDLELGNQLGSDDYPDQEDEEEVINDRVLDTAESVPSAMNEVSDIDKTTNGSELEEFVIEGKLEGEDSIDKKATKDYGIVENLELIDNSGFENPPNEDTEKTFRVSNDVESVPSSEAADIDTFTDEKREEESETKRGPLDFLSSEESGSKDGLTYRTQEDFGELLYRSYLNRLTYKIIGLEDDFESLYESGSQLKDVVTVPNNEKNPNEWGLNYITVWGEKKQVKKEPGSQGESKTPDSEKKVVLKDRVGSVKNGGKEAEERRNTRRLEEKEWRVSEMEENLVEPVVVINDEDFAHQNLSSRVLRELGEESQDMDNQNPKESQKNRREIEDFRSENLICTETMLSNLIMEDLLICPSKIGGILECDGLLTGILTGFKQDDDCVIEDDQIMTQMMFEDIERHWLWIINTKDQFYDILRDPGPPPGWKAIDPAQIISMIEIDTQIGQRDVDGGGGQILEELVITEDMSYFFEEKEQDGNVKATGKLLESIIHSLIFYFAIFFGSILISIVFLYFVYIRNSTSKPHHVLA